MAGDDQGDGKAVGAVCIEQLLRLTGEAVAGSSPAVEVVDQRQGLPTKAVQVYGIAIGIEELQRLDSIPLGQAKGWLRRTDRGDDRQLFGGNVRFDVQIGSDIIARCGRIGATGKDTPAIALLRYRIVNLPG